MQALLNRLVRIEARLNDDGECRCPEDDPPPVVPPGCRIVSRQELPPVTLPCPRCKKAREVTLVQVIYGPPASGVDAPAQ
jgi:hypothetical protein